MAAWFKPAAIFPSSLHERSINVDEGTKLSGLQRIVESDADNGSGAEEGEAGDDAAGATDAGATDADANS